MMEIQDKRFHSKPNFFPWIFLLLGTVCLFLLAFSFYPISTFHSYEGVVEQEGIYIVKIYVPQKQFPDLATSSFYVNHEKREGKIIGIKSSSELGLMAGYFELTIDVFLKEEEKIENNLVQVAILEREETMLQRWNRTWKERIDLWLS